MKKIFVIVIMFMSMFILVGCFEDRIYVDIQIAEAIESYGPYENLSIYYSGYKNEWDIEVKKQTLCGEVRLETYNGSLLAGFKELQTQVKCFEKNCK